MQQIIHIDAANQKIGNSYSSNADHVFFICDSSKIPLSLTLPDCRSGNQHQLIFKNIGYNTVTVTAQTGQAIDGGTSYTLEYNDFITFISNLKTGWITDMSLSFDVGIDPPPIQDRIPNSIWFKILT